MQEIKITRVREVTPEDLSLIAHYSTKAQGDIAVIKGGKKVNAKSIMGLFSLALKRGDVIYLDCSSVDKEDVIKKITALLTV